jgi:hypothetical protein
MRFFFKKSKWKKSEKEIRNARSKQIFFNLFIIGSFSRFLRRRIIITSQKREDIQFFGLIRIIKSFELIIENN